MTTAIIGLGRMGRGLAARLAGQTDLVLGSRDEGAARSLAASLGARGAGINDAVAQAAVVVLALPYAAALALAAHPGLAGKVVVDMSNPITPDFSGLLLGFDRSAAEEIQGAAPGARVVKAFNTIFAELLDAPREGTAAVPVFVAGDDGAAVDAVADLAARAGFGVERAGGLDAARLLEPLGMLNIRLGYGLGLGTGVAPAWVRLAA